MSLLSRLLQIDLAGRITHWQRRYKSDHREFDYRRIYCSVTQWAGPSFSISAAAYCADPLVTEGSSSTLRLYRTSAKFKSQVEAEAHLQEQVRAATTKHPDTKFYRRLFVDAVERTEKGRVEPPLEAYENGQWVIALNQESTAVCPCCGASTNGPTCSNCGEQFYS